MRPFKQELKKHNLFNVLKSKGLILKHGQLIKYYTRKNFKGRYAENCAFEELYYEKNRKILDMESVVLTSVKVNSSTTLSRNF